LAFLKLLLVLPDPDNAWREMLLFAIAGLCTAWGLTLAGGFGQERRPWVAGVMGILGYSVGWFIWQASVSSALPHRLLTD
jgi:hypothetical protein